MLHGLLIGLKIIGMILLVLLILIGFVIMSALFVPVRYRVSGSYHGKLKGKVRFTWLLHMISLLIEYDQHMSVVLRVFGIKIFPRKKKQKKPKRNIKKVAESPPQKQTADGGAESPPQKQTADGGAEEFRNEEEMLKQKTSDVIETVKEPAETATDRKKSIQLKKTKSAKSNRISKEKESVFIKIRTKISSFIVKIKRVKVQLEDIISFLQDEENIKIFKLIWKEIIRVIRHILPRRGEGNIVFGFEDPYITGQVLTAISPLYGWYPKRLDIIPVFDQNIFDAEGSFYGRMRMSTLTFWLLRVYRKKRVKEWIKKWRSRGDT